MTTARKHRWFCWCATASLVVCTAGCALFTRDYYEDYRTPPKQLHEVMAVRLEERALLPPISVHRLRRA